MFDFVVIRREGRQRASCSTLIDRLLLLNLVFLQFFERVLDAHEQNKRTHRRSAVRRLRRYGDPVGCLPAHDSSLQ